MQVESPLLQEGSRHEPVLLQEVAGGLRWTTPHLRIADFTVGGAGHLQFLLEQHRELRPAEIIAVDQDPSALERAKKRLREFEPIKWIHSNFRDLKKILAPNSLDRILVDLGVSSFQLDQAERGFSFQKDGPLDMRMNPTQGEPISVWLARCSESELRDVIRDYGEEPRASYFARKWLSARPKTLHPEQMSTLEFVRALGFEADSKDRSGRHPLTRMFQALRMKTNEELESLHELLEFVPEMLAESGRLAIISFHSLEDREVKWSLKSKLKPINKKVIIASREEAQRNPRSRSAKLRVYEKSSM